MQSLRELLGNVFCKNKNNSNGQIDLINELPEDLLEEIFINIPAKDLCLKTMRVCKKWRSIIDSDTFWIEKCLRDKKLD